MWNGHSADCSRIEGFATRTSFGSCPRLFALGIQLTSQEFAALFRVPRSALASLGARLDDRICRLYIQRGEIAR